MTMAAKNPTSPATMDCPEETSDTSSFEKSQQESNQDNAPRGGTTRKRKPSLPNNNLSIHPTPYMTLQNPVFNIQALSAPPNNERSYLLEIRQRQHERGERLADALHIIEVRITSKQSKGEARKLHKEAALLKKKIIESLRQEELITLRLKDIDNEEFHRNPYWQAQSAGSMPYATHWSPYSPVPAWSPMTLAMMSPIHGPLSPLTPLSPGLYHPSPIAPSPMTSPDWLGAQFQYPYQTLGSYVQTDPACYVGSGFQQVYIPGINTGPLSRRQSLALAPTIAKLGETKHKADKFVDFRLSQEGEYRGRRWSLADTFSPTPKDKRMGIPGLETIWKENKEIEGPASTKGHVEWKQAVE